MDIVQKLEILADAAKYDASCASSGSKRARQAGPDGIGNTEGMGICHSYTPDGRCVSLLKILLTNYCVYDCSYCINRRTSDVRRARFTTAEVVRITLEFYRRNYIEGLFLSSGIIQSSDYTMEQLVSVARTLRTEHGFGGYIHLKTIPEANPELIAEAGRWADRLSINVELPTQQGLDALAPEKELVTIKRSMGHIRDGIAESKAERARSTKAPPFAPAGQSTQMIVGATDAPDRTILGTATALYTTERLRRVYYTAFSPIPDASSNLPLVAPPLVREHRLYQADWLMRFYGFDATELTSAAQPNLDLAIDPKLAWALRNRERFPVNVNTASKAELLRIPGIGAKNVKRMLQIRRWHALRVTDLHTLRIPMRRALPFVITADHNPAAHAIDVADLQARVAPKRYQMELFGAGVSAMTGQL